MTEKTVDECRKELLTFCEDPRTKDEILLHLVEYGMIPDTAWALLLQEVAAFHLSISPGSTVSESGQKWVRTTRAERLMAECYGGDDDGQRSRIQPGGGDLGGLPHSCRSPLGAPPRPESRRQGPESDLDFPAQEPPLEALLRRGQDRHEAGGSDILQGRRADGRLAPPEARRGGRGG